MTFLPTYGPAERFMRNSAPRTPQVDRDVRGTVPGIVPIPLADARYSDAAQLAVAFGLIDNLSDSTRQVILGQAAIDRSQRGDIEDQQRNVAQMQDQQRRALEGIGVREARTKLPLLLADIANSRDVVPPDQIETRARDLLSGALPGLDGISSQAAQDFAIDNLIAGYTARNASLQEEGRRFATETILEGAAAAQDPADIEETIQSLKPLNPGVPEDSLRNRVVRKALELQAETGTVERFDQLASLGPGVDAGDVARMRARLVSRDTIEAGRRFDEDVAQGLIDVRDNVLTFKDLRERVRASGASARDVQPALEKIDSEEAQYRRAQDDDVLASETAVLTADVAAAMDGAGASALPEKVTLRLPSGREETVYPRRDLAPVVLDQKFQQIDESFPIDPAGDPQQNLANAGARMKAKVEYLGRQGGAVAYEPWKAALNGAGYLAVSPDLTSENVPPRLLEAVALHRQLRELGADAVLSAHLTDGASRDFLRTVDTMQSLKNWPTPQVVSEVARIPFSRMQAGAAPTMPRDVIEKAVKEAARGATNAGDIRDAIENRVKVGFLLGGGGDPKKLAEAAVRDVKEDFVTVHGLASYTGGRALPPDVEQIGNDLRAFYTASHGEQGYANGDLALSIDGNSGQAYLVERHGDYPGLRAEGSPILTTEDLNAASEYAAGLARAEKLASTMKSNARARFNRGQPRAVPLQGIVSMESYAAIEAIRNRPNTAPPPESADAGAAETISRAEQIPEDAPDSVRPFLEFIRDRRRKPAPSTAPASKRDPDFIPRGGRQVL